MTEFPRNTLGDEDSPYLLQHAGNPVAWQPWREEAFARAKRENLPVFLSIGYSTCHWCHVMEHESFENQRIAEFLNRHFVSIKVDREERPDVDMTYMTYVQATTGHGGWPMTVFLTPEGLPFFGGTYFPPDDRHGRTGFLNLLARIHELWSAHPADLVESARSALSQLRAATTPDRGDGVEIPEAGKLARAGTAVFARQFDTGYAGFGNAPKFPRPAAPAFLLEVARRWPATEHGREALGMASATLLAMADGGIHDHLGGGFHRYAVDRIWHIPHYEKMLYDQAQIAPLYLEMARLTGNPAMGAVAEGIFTYVMRDLSHPEGGFYSAEDADSLPETEAKAKREGAYYVFTAEEIGQVLDPESLQIFAAAYGVVAEGNVDPNSDPHGELEGTNTLYRASGLAKLAEKFGRSLPDIHRLLEEAKAKVLAYRESRPRPHRDEKIVLGWNGLMIGALASGGRLLGRADWTDRAEMAARFVLARLRDAGTGCYFRSLHTRAPVVKAFASDLTQWISGLLDLHGATGNLEWLRIALEAQEQLDRLHRDEEDGCYFSARDDGGLHVLSLKEDHDGAEPSPNSLGALNLLRLARLTGNESFAHAARRIITAHAGGLANAPHVAPMLAVAAMRLDHDGGQAVLAPSDHPDAAALGDALGRIAPPGLAIIHLPGSGPERDWWLTRHPWMAGLTGADGVPTVHLCREQTCGLPISDPAALAALLS